MTASRRSRRPSRVGRNRLVRAVHPGTGTYARREERRGTRDPGLLVALSSTKKVLVILRRYLAPDLDQSADPSIVRYLREDV